MSQVTFIDKLRWGAFVVFAALGLSLCSYRYVSPGARSARDTLKHLSSNHVSVIILEPGKENSLISTERYITDPLVISRWVSAMSPLEGLFPNHPDRRRCMFISFVTPSGKVGGELCTQASGRPLFEQMSSIHSGWVYGEYLLPSHTDLERLLQDTEHTQAAPNNSFKPKPLRGSA